MVPSRKTLSLKEKVDIIHYSLNNSSLSIRKLAETFRIGRTPAKEILKNKEELLRMYRSGTVNEHKFRFHKQGSGELIDKVVIEWYNRVKSKNVTVSGPMVQEKAEEVAKHLNVNNFKASNGWLDRFKKRHKIVFKHAHGEGSSADNSIAAGYDWFSNIADIIKGYSAEDIFNADETSLYYRALPDNMSYFKGGTSPEQNLENERLTVLLCANMIGQKMEPLVIGKASKPRCFRGFDVSHLGVQWKANPKAWMTSTIMTVWLEDLDRLMKSQGRKILLFLDNATSHVQMNLDNIQLVLFPPNVASTAQPFDLGVTQNFKVKYRLLALRHLIATLEVEKCTGTRNTTGRIDEFNAITWIEKSWNDITPATISNCFKKAGFLLKTLPVIEDDDFFRDVQLLDGLLSLYPLPVEGDYAHVDDDLATESTSENIVDILAYVRPLNDSGDQQDDECCTEDHVVHEESATVSHSKVLIEMNRIRLLYLENGDSRGLKMITDLILHQENEFCQLT